MSDKEFGVVANIEVTDRILRNGTKVWLIGGTGGEGWDRFVVHGLSRSPRRIEKWIPTKRLSNFRAAWMPPHIREKFPHPYFSGSRSEMEELAANLDIYAESLRQIAA